jgi:long-chain acyl-CoA synthetase
MSLNLAIILRESAAAHPDKVAVRFEGLDLSYRQIDELSNQVAEQLHRAGIGRDDAVGLMLPNVPQFVIAYFGILKAGARVVPMNVLLKAPEVAHYLSDSDAKAFIAWIDVAAEAVRGAAGSAVQTTWVAGLPGQEVPAGTHPFDELLRGDPRFEFVNTAADDVAVLLYTSGTTGRPKGAELTHFQLFQNCDIAGRLFGVRDDDVVVAVLPLFHVFGLSSVMNVAVRYGGTMTLVPRFDPAKVLEVVQRDRATIFSGVPTMFHALLHHPKVDDYDHSSLRVCNSGGASIPGEVLRGFEEKFGVVILEGYGLSETASAACFNRSVEERRVLSIGKPIYGVEVRVVDEDGKELAAGSDNVGEIVIRGHNVMKGYYKNPEATAEAFKGGWFHTGDMGYRDDEGFFFIVDRKKELIIRGGYNVYPREVEEVLYAHPAVAEAAVIGVPDQRLGEEVAAIVVLRPGAQASEQEIIDWTRERVAAYKHPRSVRFVDALPKGPTGKVLKKELKVAPAPAGR